MLVIAGLGNPGARYENTRHNIGFRITGALAEKFGISGKMQPKFKAIVGKGRIHDTEVVIVQPQTFMNLSGEAVATVLNWYNLDINDLFVVYDDVMIDFGRVRFRPSGSAGSHNGIKSIISCCGSEEFARLRVGIGPNPGGILWKNYVLQKFSKDEVKHLPKITEFCVDAIEFYIKNGMAESRNRFNGVHILEEKE